MAIIRSISLDKELHGQAQEYCELTGRTFSGLVAFLVKKYLEEHEDGGARSKNLFEKKD